MVIIKEAIVIILGFIGAGKVGCSLARYFSERGIAVSGLFGRSGVPSWLPRLNTAQEVIEKSDVIFITVTDSAITDVWNGLDISDNKIICHCSGSLSSEIFTGANPSQVCSVHPMLAFAGKNVPEEQISKAFFTIEGGDAAISAVGAVLEACGNPYRVISPLNKVKYHAAACFASNFAVAVCARGFELMRQCGFSEEEARTAMTPLIMGNAENICSRGIKASLTGPVSRGDAVTVEKHLGMLEGADKEIYRLLSAELADLSGHSELADLLGGSDI